MYDQDKTWITLSSWRMYISVILIIDKTIFRSLAVFYSLSIDIPKIHLLFLEKCSYYGAWTANLQFNLLYEFFH